MFTVKKTKEGLVVDPEKPHSTMDIHFFNGKTEQICITCNKGFKEGEVCGILQTEGEMGVAHERCPSA